jgi:hypothetical protein
MVAPHCCWIPTLTGTGDRCAPSLGKLRGTGEGIPKFCSGKIVVVNRQRYMVAPHERWMVVPWERGFGAE